MKIVPLKMITSHIIATTGRLTIRLLKESDVASVASLWTDERVTRFMGGPRDFEKVCTSLRDSLTAQALRFDLWPVVETSSDRVVGHCGLLPKTVDGSEQIELVYVIEAAHWGRGYATEAASAIRDYAFRTLSVPRLVSLINPDNNASERVALKVGMKFETETIRPGGRMMRVYAIESSARQT